jgi:large subunit ribosomal protein L13
LTARWKPVEPRNPDTGVNARRIGQNPRRFLTRVATMKTFTATPADIDKKWILIDAEGVVLGRLASIIAMRLRGKHKASFTPHMDMGDNVIVINADKVQLTGRKRTDKTYYRHTGHPGGIKSTTAEKVLDGKHPERVLELAVKRMLPGNKLSRQQMTNLRIYAGTAHPHEAQSPEVLDVKTLNPKNTRSA